MVLGASLVLLAASATAAEPFYGTRLVNAQQLWPYTTGRGVRVAVIDTGIDGGHPALRVAYRGGYDFVRNDDNPDEETAEAHGTAVAGVILQIAPDVELFSLKIFGKENSFESADLVRAIDWAIANRIDVLNMSFALKTGFDAVRRAIERAEAAGIVVVAAAGNAGGAIDAPASFAMPIAVGAVDKDREVAGFSNRGPELDLVAPGVDIYSPAAVGSGIISHIVAGSITITATAFTGARFGEVTGLLVDCGTGRLDEIPAALEGNVALLRMADSVPLGTALGNIYRGGALGLIVVNQGPRFYYSNVNPPGYLPPMASIGSDDAARLQPNEIVHLSSALGDYRFTYGTSLAAPNVAAVVALLKSLAPDASPAQIRGALFMGVRDLGSIGLDFDYGWGLVDAYAAARFLAPEKLLAPERRRSVAH